MAQLKYISLRKYIFIGVGTMHFDLSIPVDSADVLRGDELARVREMISTARQLGYSCVALDYRARLPLRPNDMCRLQCSALSADASPPQIIDHAAARLSASAPMREFSALLSKRDAARVAFAAARDGKPSHKRRREVGGAARVDPAPKPPAPAEDADEGQDSVLDGT